MTYKPKKVVNIITITILVRPRSVLISIRPPCCCAIWVAVRVAASVLGSPSGAILVVGWTVAPSGTVAAVWPGIILDAVRSSCGAIRIGTILGPPCGAVLVVGPSSAILFMLRPCVPILIAMRISCGAVGGGQVLAMRIVDRT